MAVVLLYYSFFVEEVERNGNGKVILRGKNHLDIAEVFNTKKEDFPVTEDIRPGDNIIRVYNQYWDLLAIEIRGR